MNQNISFKESRFHVEGLIDAPSKDYLESTLDLLDLYSYRVESEKDYMTRLDEEKKIVGKVTPCQSSNFHEIECLEDKDSFGFFNSENDVRPGHATWIKKADAEKLYALIKIQEGS